MSILLHADSSESSSLEDLVDHLQAARDLEDEDELAALGPRLAALCNNRGFLAEMFHRDLQDLEAFEKRHEVYNAQSFSLVRHERFTVRCNVWPRAGRYPVADDELNFFSYGLPHDHNFSLLTAGYQGPGYRTDVYTYDYGSVRGHEGEPVSLSYLETVDLARGTVALFRKNHHIHVQHAATDLSVSINVIPSPSGWSRQYCFDLERGLITRILPHLEPRVDLLRFAGLLGDAETLERLQHAARRGRIPVLELSLRRAISQLERRLQPGTGEPPGATAQGG